jgi:hypothetical protein
MPIIYEYSTKYDSDIESILATLDAKPGNFPNQTQTNQDFWVTLKSATTLNKMQLCRHTYQDEKSGMDMLKHSTRVA